MDPITPTPAPSPTPIPDPNRPVPNTKNPATVYDLWARQDNADASRKHITEDLAIDDQTKLAIIAAMNVQDIQRSDSIADAIIADAATNKMDLSEVVGRIHGDGSMSLYMANPNAPSGSKLVQVTIKPSYEIPIPAPKA